MALFEFYFFFFWILTQSNFFNPFRILARFRFWILGFFLSIRNKGYSKFLSIRNFDPFRILVFETLFSTLKLYYRILQENSDFSLTLFFLKNIENIKDSWGGKTKQ